MGDDVIRKSYCKRKEARNVEIQLDGLSSRRSHCGLKEAEQECFYLRVQSRIMWDLELIEKSNQMFMEFIQCLRNVTLEDI